ncbi:MAG: hypothetical protein ACRC46_02390 [Thermoguttaceae bacterium]
MTSIAELRELIAENIRHDEERRAEAARREAESARRDAEYQAAAEKRDAEYQAAAEKRDAEYKAAAEKREAEYQAFRKEMQAEHKKTEDIVRKISHDFHSQWARLVESLCANQVVPLLNSRGIEVHQIGERMKTRLPTGGYFEIDIVAINGDTVVLIEVKTTLRPGHVDWFIEKLGLARKMFHKYSDCRFLGGVAFLHADSEADNVAQNKGLFTILATGNGATITNEESFSPKVW